MSTESLHRLLIDAAEREASAVAVADEGSSLSFGELAGVAGALQVALRSVGVERGDRVGLFVRKSRLAVAAVHACLATGAVYVPVDPKSPRGRAEMILDGCAARAVLADASTAAAAESIAAATGAAVVRIDEERPPTDLAVVDVDPDDLAYLLHTSGSTGRPKGVMLSHRNGAHFVSWAVEKLGLRPADRFSSHAPFHFDLSVFDLFASTMVGGSVHMVPPSTTMFPADLAAFITERELTVWYSVPTALRLLIERGGVEPGGFPSLRHVIFAGEVYPTQGVRALRTHLPATRLWNFYGPTETNVCTYHEVVAVPEDGDLPIGRPIGGVEARVIPLGQSEADGPGELQIAGPTVFAGYWGDPARSAEVVEDESDAAGRRWYRTGDLVTSGPEGFVFHGRRDHQVKSRGHRIELGEVESALHRHPSIEGAVVVAVQDEVDGHVLCAAVELVEGESASVADLRRFARAELPAYMVPTTIVLVDALPLTTNGKHDRLAVQTLADAGTDPTSGGK